METVLAILVLANLGCTGFLFYRTKRYKRDISELHEGLQLARHEGRKAADFLRDIKRILRSR